MYHTVQMGWDGHVGQCRSVVAPMVYTSYGIPVYYMVQMGWDGHVQRSKLCADIGHFPYVLLE